MSNDTDKIREMVMALSRGDHEAAQSSSSEVMASKMSKTMNEAHHDRPGNGMDEYPEIFQGYGWEDISGVSDDTHYELNDKYQNGEISGGIENFWDKLSPEAKDDIHRAAEQEAGGNTRADLDYFNREIGN